MVEMRTHLATERAGMETLHLQAHAPQLYTDPRRLQGLLKGMESENSDDVPPLYRGIDTQLPRRPTRLSRSGFVLPDRKQCGRSARCI